MHQIFLDWLQTTPEKSECFNADHDQPFVVHQFSNSFHLNGRTLPRLATLGSQMDAISENVQDTCILRLDDDLVSCWVHHFCRFLRPKPPAPGAHDGPMMGPGLGANGPLHFVHATFGICLHRHLGLLGASTAQLENLYGKTRPIHIYTYLTYCFCNYFIHKL